MSFDLETRYLRLTIGNDATVLKFQDKVGKKDYSEGKKSFAQIKKAGTIFEATKAEFADGKISIDFGDSGVSAVIGAKNCGKYLLFEVVSVSSNDIEEFAFFNYKLNLKGALSEPFAACLLALDLQTNVVEMPGPNSVLTAKCYPKFGMPGAETALVACPTDQMRTVMKEAITAAPELPHSNLGGPWAYDNKITRGSYLFNFGDMSEKTVDAWIDMVKSIGITQIDFHGGVSFRFGDCLPNPETYPEGKKSFKAVIDKLHAAGILAGQHTYAFFIDKRCPWVTPVPSPDLAKDATFTLNKDISEGDATVVVNETTKDMSVIMGFAVRNSVTIQIDDELITYTGVSKEAPFTFSGCVRGANGTKPAPHSAGAKVHHLKECFGLFLPDPDSKLFMDVVEANADFYNECGFDMMYLDALDGEDTLGGWDNTWHYGSKFVFELVKRLKKAPIMEMSTFHHHLWYVRSRAGAWDHPNRGYKDFVDLHAENNMSSLNMFLPSHLGWWAIVTANTPYTEATYTDDIEYLLAKCAAWDCGLSPMVFTPETYASTHNLQRLGGLIKKWEDLRQSGFFTEADKVKLREPGAGFTLTEQNGKKVVRRMFNDKHKVENLNSSTSNWLVKNPYDAQPVKLRIQALTSVADYDDPGSKVLLDFNDLSVLNNSAAAPGITMNITPSADIVKAGGISGQISADGPKGSLSNPTWAKVGHTFATPTSFAGTGGMGAWIYGDGKGELLNIQITSPEWAMSGNADHYVTVDFHGWRYFEFVEPEGDRVNDYLWPYSKSAYGIYREFVNYASLQTVTVWCNNLPGDGPIKCYISPIKALPLVANKIVNPTVTVSGKSIKFPVELETNWYLEYNSPTDCKLYNAKGDFISDIKPELDSPTLIKGENIVRFNCDAPAAYSARAIVTVTGIGESL